MFSPSGYDALRHGVGVVRRSDRGVIRVAGLDRLTWLQGLVTNDVLPVKEGERSYGAYLSPQGRMITDLWVVPVADALLLDVPAVLAASLAARLDGFIFAEDVQVVDETAALAAWAAYGPGIQATLKDCLHAGDCRPDTSLGVPGCIFYLPATDVLPPAFADLPEVNLDTLDVVRIEAGVPRFLVDMTEDTIPLEAGIENRAISFTKGCYVGQEIIVRVTQRGGGRVARRLVGFTSDRLLPVGAGLQSGGRDIGRVTSSTFSPTLARHIALGYVHRDFVLAGTPVEVLDGGARIPATVADVPFVPPVA